MNIVNVGYDSTNYYVLADSQPRLLIDVGFPGTLPKLQYQCKRMGIDLPNLKHLLATHYHPDHAGLVQELKDQGCKLIVMETQVSAVPRLQTYMKPEQKFVPIKASDNLVVSLDNSRAFLARIGISGEIVSTPGHSDDSVTLILDDEKNGRAAFTGDLPHPMIADTMPILKASWDRLRALNVRTIYPGHGPVWHLE